MSNPDQKPLLYLIDGSSYVYRAYHAIPHLSTRTGEPTNAVLGFVNMVQKTLRDGGPTHAAVAFDTKEPTFRHLMYDEYKANREAAPEELKRQIPRIREVVDALNLPAIVVPGWEADDLIGTLAIEAAGAGFDVVMVTGDKDFMQLIRPGIRMYDGMRDRWIDAAAVEEKFGVGPDRVIDAMALMGDSSDNVPGVKGIGPKTAARLLQQFGTLDGVYEHLDQVKSESQRQKLEDGREQAAMSKKLVTIALDAPMPVPLEELARRSPDVDRLRALYTELEFTRQLADLGPQQTIEAAEYGVVLTVAELESLAKKLMDSSVFAVEIMSDHRRPMQSEIVGLAFAWAPGHAAYVPMGHTYLLAPKQLGLGRVLDVLGPLLEDAGQAKCVQHAKDAHLALGRAGVELRGVTGDVLLFDYLLNPGKSRTALAPIAQSELGHTATSLEDVVGRGKKATPFEEAMLDGVTPFACEAADLVLRLCDRLGKRVDGAGQRRVYEEIDHPLSRVLAEVERAGVHVDPGRLEALSAEFGGRMSLLEKEIHAHAGHEFLIHSTKQLREVLFDELGLPVLKRTKTGPSTDVTVLEELAAHHPLPRTILEYRRVSKLKSTYLDALPRLVDPHTGRIHTRFSQITAATGRLASSEPNLQNIPIRTEDGRRIREAFTAQPGAVLVSADYSQIELRVLAHLSGDEALIEAFTRGDDIHALTASELLDVPLDAVTQDHRRIAKAINYGIVYGMSAFRLARDLGLERREAQEYIDGYFARYESVARWLEETRRSAHADGQVRTLFGRRRLLPDLASRNRNVQMAAERTAVNTPIQGTAADIIKLAMLRVHAGLPAVSEQGRMILQVHDELLLEVPQADGEAVAAWLQAEMASAYPLRVPTQVDVGVGVSWADAH